MASRLNVLLEPPLAHSLRAAVRGDVRFDSLSRTIYSTDASIYEIVPIGVVCPKDIADVVATMHECSRAGVSIVARGAGTGLTGGAVGPGLQLDLSRYMNRLGPFDVNDHTIHVEPGVVLDELNAYVAPHGLQFAPDVATSSRATIGGMIANNSCGSHSIVYGRTVDHVAGLTVALADGEVVTFGNGSTRNHQRSETINIELGRIRDAHYKEIVHRFPKVMRSNGGYGLDRLGPPGTPADAIKVLCGSEGTLGIIVGAKLKLVRIPQITGLLVLHFDDLFASLRAAPLILEHSPSAVELVDRLIIEGGRANQLGSSGLDFLQGSPEDILVVEFAGDDLAQVEGPMERLAADPRIRTLAVAQTRVLEPDRQRNVWNLRNAGLGLMMSRPGDAQPYSFVEDTAVEVTRLADYIRRFGVILQREGVEAGYYAHASVGVLHVKPILNLKLDTNVERMRRIAESISELAVEFGGSVTGEHGDGIVRSCWLEKLYGPQIISAFKEVKALFDPQGRLNPHKIVDPWPMTEHLRYGGSFATANPKTHFDFATYGGMAGLAGMCSGVGQCRQKLVGTMCPSYMATGDEKHSTRGRANALRVALSNRGLIDGLDDPSLAEAMDLCISCKACKTECPTGVDMARLKSEYLAHRNKSSGVSRRARWIAEFPERAAWGALLPRTTNAIVQSRFVRAVFEWRLGLDRRMPPPRFAGRSFRAWFRKHSRARPNVRPKRDPVIYFVDTWTNYFTPKVGEAVVWLLEHAGFEVQLPPPICCGRPAISQGLLGEVTELARSNVRALSRLAAGGVPIVGSEPSCVLTLVDEYPQLVRSLAARRIAEQTFLLETFLEKVFKERPGTVPPPSGASGIPLRIHPHCHQKAIVGTKDLEALARRFWGDRASLINAGCCGMAGSFGHEAEHYEIARAIGEERLFPAVRGRGSADIAVTGFSCRHQIAHHTGVPAKHLAEYLQEAFLDRL